MSVDIDSLYRQHYSKLVSSLISLFGLQEIEFAEDIVQEAFLAAMEHWPENPPDAPEAWLYRVCKNKAINAFQKQKNARQRSSAWHADSAKHDEYKVQQVFLPHEIRDNQLRLMFALSHPKLSERTRIILILRILMGFKLEEIASVFGLSKVAVKKILVRGKQDIHSKGITLKTPYIFQLTSRLQAVHRVLYLVFNEGYSASIGDQLIKKDLCREAIRLTKLLMDEGIGNSVTPALMALMLFNIARFEARLSSSGEIIDLAHQDRSKWDRALITSAWNYLKLSQNGELLSSYHLEAGIAFIHSTAPSFEATDWCLIVKYYDKLMKINNSPFVELNRAIALGYCQGPSPAIDILLNPKLADHLKAYYLYHITLAKLYHQIGKTEVALGYINKGLALAKLEQERQYILNLKKAMH